MTNTKVHNVPAALIVTAIVAAVAANGCATTSEVPSGAVIHPTCTSPPTITPKTPTVAILTQVGHTVSAPNESTVINGATGIKAHVIVNGIGSGTSAPNLAANTVLVGVGENDSDRGPNLQCKQGEVKTALKTLANKKNAGDLDVFAALQNLQGDLVGDSPAEPTSVVLIGSLLNSASPANLTSSATLTHPVQAINGLAAQGLVPKCTGWRVYAVGADATMGRSLSDSQAAELKNFWRLFFAHCGGALVQWDTALDRFPVTTGALPAADTSQIPIEHKPRREIVTLASDVTFAVGSARLRGGAHLELTQLLRLIPPGLGRVVVKGFTDNTGSEAINVPLSRARARALARWLVRRGIAASRIIIHGYGAHDAVSTNATSRGRQANRRVTVTIYTNER